MNNSSKNLKQLTHQLTDLSTITRCNKLFVVVGKNQIRKDFFIRFLRNQMKLALSEEIEISTLTDKELLENGLQLSSPSFFDTIQVIHVLVSTKASSNKKTKPLPKNGHNMSILEKVLVRHSVVLNVQELQDFLDFGLELHSDVFTILNCDANLNRAELLDLIAFVGQQTGATLNQGAKNKILNHLKENLSNLYELVEKWILMQSSNLNDESTAEMFDDLTSRVSHNHVFDLFELLRSKRINEAELLLDQLINQGEEEVFLLGVLFKYAKDRAILSGKPASGFFMKLSDTDFRLKSSRTDPKALLTDLMESLR